MVFKIYTSSCLCFELEHFSCRTSTLLLACCSPERTSALLSGSQHKETFPTICNFTAFPFGFNDVDAEFLGLYVFDFKTFVHILLMNVQNMFHEKHVQDIPNIILPDTPVKSPADTVGFTIPPERGQSSEGREGKNREIDQASKLG